MASGPFQDSGPGSQVSRPGKGKGCDRNPVIPRVTVFTRSTETAP